jgi:hypothetical protein
MISVDTDAAGVRTYQMPKAVADVAIELFPYHDQLGAVFNLAKAVSLADLHTTENIALTLGHTKAVEFASERMGKQVRAVRH